MAQGWRSGESTRLPPMWPGFDSRTRRHKWVESVLVLFSASRVCLWVLRFSLLRKNQLIPAGCKLCSKVTHGPRIAAARGANVCFRFDLVELRRCCTF